MKTCAVLVCYRLRQAKDEAVFLQMLRNHRECLLEEGLAMPVVMPILKSGLFYIEPVVWKNPEAAAKAHENAKVLQVWGAFEALVDFVSMAEMPNSQEPFPKFETVELPRAKTPVMEEMMISTRDFKAMKSYYQSVFGLLPICEQDCHAILVDKTSALALCLTVGESLSSPGPSFQTKDLAGLLDRVQSAGGSVTKTWEFTRMVGANVKDIEGNEALIWQEKSNV